VVDHFGFKSEPLQFFQQLQWKSTIPEWPRGKHFWSGSLDNFSVSAGVKGMRAAKDYTNLGIHVDGMFWQCAQSIWRGTLHFRARSHGNLRGRHRNGMSVVAKHCGTPQAAKKEWENWNALGTHPNNNILQGYGMPDANRSFLLMEPMDLDLMQFVVKNSGSELWQWKYHNIKTVVKGILTGLAHMQSATGKYVHRDIKPENIFLRCHRDFPAKIMEVKLGDFGTTCLKNARGRTSAFLSLGWGAPEVLTAFVEGKPESGASQDVFSAALVIAWFASIFTSDGNPLIWARRMWQNSDQSPLLHIEQKCLAAYNSQLLKKKKKAPKDGDHFKNLTRVQITDEVLYKLQCVQKLQQGEETLAECKLQQQEYLMYWISATKECKKIFKESIIRSLLKDMANNDIGQRPSAKYALDIFQGFFSDQA